VSGRKKLIHTVGLYNSAASNAVATPGAGTIAALYPAGATVVSWSGVAGIVKDPGGLQVGDSLQLWQVADGSDTDISCTIATIVETGTPSIWAVTVDTTPSTLPVAGDRIISTTVATMYANPRDTSGTPASSISISGGGTIEGYFDERALDLYVSGGGLTAGFKQFGIPVNPGPALAVESITGAGSSTIDDDTQVVELDDSSATIISNITYPRLGRMIYVVNRAGYAVGLLATTIPSSDGDILSANSVPLADNAGIVLLAVTEGSYTVWVPVGSLGDVDLADLSNITGTTGGLLGDVLRVSSTSPFQLSSGQSFGDTATGNFLAGALDPDSTYYKSGVYKFRLQLAAALAADKDFELPDGSSDPERLAGLYCDQTFTGACQFQTLRVKSGSYYGALVSSTLSANRSYTLPDEDIDLGNAGKHRSILVTMPMSAAGGLESVLSGSGPNALLALKPDVPITITGVKTYAHVFGAVGTPDVILGLYQHSSLPTSTSTPPGAGTGIGSLILDTGELSASSLYEAALSVSTSVTANQFVFVAIQSGSTWPTNTTITIQIDYDVQ